MKEIVNLSAKPKALPVLRPLDSSAIKLTRPASTKSTLLKDGVYFRRTPRNFTGAYSQMETRASQNGPHALDVYF